MIFTSESVSPGHPDKVCDQISDAILDEALSQDKDSRVAIETLVKDNKVVLAGEISTTASIDYEKIVRKTITDIGYTKDEYGFNGSNCDIDILIGEQSRDISVGVDREGEENLGAGDQGLMFGYANNETDVLMPAPIIYSHLLMKKHRESMISNSIEWLRPDAKSQLSFKYVDGKIDSIDTVVLSTQHDPEVTIEEIRETVKTEIILPTLPEQWITKNTNFLINPTGIFIIGGPVGDAGLTGRKIIVDTYGGMARHGGGAFSGKDPSKVDRSAAYAARHVAKSIVASGLADRCEIQISYAIGVSKPTSIHVETFGTENISKEDIQKRVFDNFDLTPYGIIKSLDLARPIFQVTSTFGHFGRTEDSFTWEKSKNLK